MSQLEEIKALERDLFIAGLPSDNALKLIAALEAVESLPRLARKTNSSDDPEHVTYSEGWDTMANGYNRALRDVQDVIKDALRDR